MSEHRPSYDLEIVKSLVERNCWRIAASASADAWATLRLDDADIKNCLLGLTASDFRKSDPSRDKPGTMLDVYKPRFAGHPCYVKLSMHQSIAGQTVVVVSFRLQ